ncbi:MAG: hypothetical protein MJ025_02350 [Victivallaceae bacterium]|nr:hypothetical protein [Victivallaceae bacterium]
MSSEVASLSFWITFAVLIFGMIVLTLLSSKYVHGVADFMSANRMARKYMLTVATGMTGAAGMIAVWQLTYKSGLSYYWWDNLGAPVGLVVAVTGFIIYRFRETRALTLGQFLEMRYSKRFRIFAGFLSWLSGIVNYGIFPLVVGKLIINILHLPPTATVHLWGGAVLKFQTLPSLMFFNLAVAVFIACVGGQVSIMLTDFYQEVICKIILVMATFYLAYKFTTIDIFPGLLESPQLVDPFSSESIEDFNIWYILIGLFGSIYNAKSWQGGSGYGSSAITPHDAQMSGVLGRWRHLGTQVAYWFPALVAYAVMHNPKFADTAAELTAAIPAGTALEGGAITTALMHVALPEWLYGAFASIIFACSISIDDSCLHSWGSIFVQDFLLPVYGKEVKQETHMTLLRLSIIAVAIWAFCFSMYYPLKMDVFMFYAITGAIYLGGAGIVIFGGLYWKRGTTAAAWTAMITGGVLAVGGMIVEMTWADKVVHYFLSRFPGNAYLMNNMDAFPINGQYMYFFAMVAAAISYVAVSLLFPKPDFNLERMLRRGIYRVADDHKDASGAPEGQRDWKERIGFSKEFSPRDAFLFWFTIVYCLFWWVVLLIGTFIWGLGKLCGFSISINFWTSYWTMYIGIQILIMIGSTIWLTIGGLVNACQLPGDMKNHKSNESDNGTVSAQTFGGTTR